MTISVFVLGCVLNTVVAVGVSWSVAAITNRVALSNPEGTIFTCVSFIACACSIVVDRGICNTAVAICCCWSSAAIEALAVACATVIATVGSHPEVVTLAASVIVLMRVVYTLVAVRGFRSYASGFTA